MKWLKANQGQPARRRMLHSMIAGLATYATSFFVTKSAFAQQCQDDINCHPGSGKCIKYVGPCSIMGSPARQYALYTDTAGLDGCCIDEEPSGTPCHFTSSECQCDCL